MAKRKPKAHAHTDECEREEYDFSHIVHGDTKCDEKIEWFWDRRIQKAALNMFEGEPGTGKSTLLTKLAATISEGGRFPGERKTWPKGKVLWFGTEERFLAKVAPRFVVSGGHLTELKHWPNTHLNPKDMIVMPHDRDKLTALLKHIGATVLAVDPFTALAPFGTDNLTEAQMRPYLESIFAATAPIGVTTLMSRHWNKDKTATAINKGGGSISISAVCRVIHAITKIPDTGKPGVMSPVKVNDEEERPPIAFSFERTTVGHPSFHWGKEVQKSTGEIIMENSQGGEDDAANDLIALFKSMLANGPRLSTEIRTAYLKEGISDSTARRVKKKLRIKSKRYSIGNTGDGYSKWVPPKSWDVGGPVK